MIEIRPDRVKSRMAQLGLSQSAVARALGLKAPSISRLANGKHGQTRHIFGLARVLRTTPDYLTGLVEDPEQDVELGRHLTADQEEWLDLYERLTEDQRQFSRALLRDLAKANTPPPSPAIHAPRPNFLGKGEPYLRS